ncbi:hypothetical protein [Oceanicoccus sp. KOV_DT_Chl]|uniref:hypothetical protein n=1 Tax=Oceanicoccus sp. KOV_DT_Chl TaxID=1904639 RepID=UPI0011AFABBD|nr:hypothetical protein [Oceanicoccus sp. KOV_DT_Chl]
MSRKHILLVTTLLVQACSTVTNETVKNNPIWRFGVVKIDISREKNETEKSDITTLGFWVDESSSGIGYNSTKKISLNDSCRIVVIVKNEEQLENLKIFFKNNDILNGDGLCIELE